MLLFFYYLALVPVLGISSKLFHINYETSKTIQKEGVVCDGSAEKPFPDLVFALNHIDKNELDEEVRYSLKIWDSEFIITKSEKFMENKNNFFDFFAKRKKLRLEVTGAPTKIVLYNINFNMLIGGGEIALKDLEIVFKEEIVPPDSVLESVSRERAAFIEVLQELTDNILIEISNFRISNSYIGSSLLLKSIFSARVKTKTEYNATMIISDSGFYNFATEESYFILLIKRIGKLFAITSQIRIKNLEVKSKNDLIFDFFLSLKALKLEKIEENSDFAFKISNCAFFASNLSIFDTSRLIIALENNKVFLSNLTIFQKTQIIAPELFIFLYYNTITIKNLICNDLYLSTNDDKISAEPDSSFVDSNLNPISFIEFFKHQSYIKFGVNNIAFLEAFNFTNFKILKANLFLVSLLSFDNLNTVRLFNMSFSLGLLDSNSHIGCSSIILINFENNISVELISFTNISSFTNTIIFSIFIIQSNKVHMKNIKVKNSYFRSKVHQQEIKEFNENIDLNYDTLHLSKAGDFRIANFMALFIDNCVYISNLEMSNIQCLYSCTLMSVLLNKIVLASVKAFKIISESLNSGLYIGMNNQIILLDLYINISRSLSGFFVSRVNNLIKFLNCYFESSWANGGSAFESFYSICVAGSVFISQFNLVSIENSAFTKGKSDIFGGALTITEFSTVLLINCRFEAIESANRLSLGGVIRLFSKASILIRDSQFLNNIGTKGGILYADYENVIRIHNCEFKSNYGEDSAVFNLNNLNYLFVHDTYFRKNNALVRGCILTCNGTSQYAFFQNCFFFGNQANMDSAVFYLEELNSLVLIGVTIQYFENHVGSGDFINLIRNNWLVIRDAFIKDIVNMENFIFAFEHNSIKVNNSHIYNLNARFLISIIYGYQEISNSIFINISLREQYKSVVKLRVKNILNMTKCFFRNLTGVDGLILVAESKNLIYSSRMQLIDGQLYSSGGCFDLVDNNFIRLTNSLFSYMSGYTISGLLFTGVTQNVFEIVNTEISPHFSIFQDKGNFPSLIYFEYENIIIFSKMKIFVKDYQNEPYQLMLFFLLWGPKNLLYLQNVTLTFQALYAGFLAYPGNRIVVMNSLFRNSRIKRSLIIMYRSVILLRNCKFAHTAPYPNANELNRNVISLSIKSIAALRGTVVKNETNFFFSSSSFIYIKNGKFFNCGLKSGLGGLININENSIMFMWGAELLRLKGGSISPILIQSSKIVFFKSSLVSCQSPEGGCLKIVGTTAAYFIECSFVWNNGLRGGSIYFENFTQIEIKRSFFIYNTAKYFDPTGEKQRGSGACFYLSEKIDPDIRKTAFVIENNFFQLNFADIGAIAYVFSIKNKHLVEDISQMNFLIENKAEFYGQTFASFPVYFGLIKGSDLNNEVKDSINIGNVRFQTNQDDECLSKLVAIDAFGQIAWDGRIFKNEYTKNQYPLKWDFAVDEEFPCLHKISVLPEVSFYGKVPAEIFLFTLNVKAMLKQTILDDHPAVEKLLPSLNITIRIDNCQVGQAFSESKLMCSDCPVNFFSFNEDFVESTSCQACTDQPFYCYGGFKLSPKAGFWRSGESSRNFIKCSSKACLGDPNMITIGPSDRNLIRNQSYELTSPTGICALGHQGVLCTKCIRGYAKGDNMKCLPCSDPINILFIALKVIFLGAVYLYFIFQALELNKVVRKNKFQSDIVSGNFLLKILMCHMQFIKVFMANPFYYPENFLEISNLIYLPFISGADKVLNMECYLNIRQINLRYFYNILTLALPIFMAILLRSGILERILYYLKLFYRICCRKIKISDFKKPRKSSTLLQLIDKESSLFSILIVALMLSYDRIFNSLLENLSMINTDDFKTPEYRLVADFQILYYSKEHQLWISLYVFPLLVLLITLLPLYIFFKLYQGQKQKNLYQNKMLFRYGYFYVAYRKNFYMYEFTYLLRKMFLISFEVFIVRLYRYNAKNNPITLLLTFFAFYSLFGSWTKSFQPYETNKLGNLNIFESFALFVQAASSWLGCLWFSLEIEELNETSFLKLIAGNIILSFGVFLNSVFMIAWCMAYWRINGRTRFIQILFRIKRFFYSLKSSSRAGENEKPIEQSIAEIEPSTVKIKTSEKKKEDAPTDLLMKRINVMAQRIKQLESEARLLQSKLKLFQKENSILRLQLKEIDLKKIKQKKRKKLGLQSEPKEFQQKFHSKRSEFEEHPSERNDLTSSEESRLSHPRAPVVEANKIKYEISRKVHGFRKLDYHLELKFRVDGIPVSASPQVFISAEPNVIFKKIINYEERTEQMFHFEVILRYFEIIWLSETRKVQLFVHIDWCEAKEIQRLSIPVSISLSDFFTFAEEKDFPVDFFSLTTDGGSLNRNPNKCPIFFSPSEEIYALVLMNKNIENSPPDLLFLGKTGEDKSYTSQLAEFTISLMREKIFNKGKD